jgi:RNA polymerase sigma factor (sigma-70 family)
MSDLLVRSLVKLTHDLAIRHEADRTLLARYASAKDAGAFAELLRRHGPLVLGVCRRMLGCTHDAEDAFQATFLVLVRSGGSVRKPDALSAWLYGTAVRMCRRVLRKRRGQRLVAARAGASEDLLAELAWKEVCGLLDEEVGRLPAFLRDPLLLCYFKGLARDEAAEKLGWSRRTLMRRLEAARARLRVRLERRGVATLALGAAVLFPSGLEAQLPSRLAARAGALASGACASPAVRALARSGSARLAKVVAGLLLLLAGGSLGLVAASPTAIEPGQLHASSELAAFQDEPPRTNREDQPLPPGAIHRLGSRKFRIEGRSDFMLPSPDGKYVLIHPQPSLSAYAAHGLFLLDADSGLRVRTFEASRRVPKCGTQEAIRPVAFSPDGAKLYGLGWHPSEKDGDGFAQWANFDNPSRRVVLVWEVATGKRVAEWDLPPGNRLGASLLGVTVSPDGKQLYVYGAVRMGTGPDRTIRGEHGVHVLDAANGKVLHSWDNVGCPAGFLTGAKEVITFRRGAEIAAYDTESGKRLRTYPLAGYIASVALSPDGKTVAAVSVAEESGRPSVCAIKLWEAATGRAVQGFAADVKTVGYSGRLVFAPDGKALFLGTTAGRLLRWDLAKGTALPDCPAHRGMVADLFLRPGSKEILSCGGRDGALRRWDLATSKMLSKTDAYVGEIAAARTPDGKGVAIVDATGRLDWWDVAKGRIVRTLQAPGRNQQQLLFTPDGKNLLVAAQDGPNSIWDWSTGEQIGEFTLPSKKDPKAEEYWWGTLGFSPDGGQLLASKFGRGTWMWTWPERKVLWHDAREMECCAFPSEDTVVCSEWHQPIEFRDLKTGVIKREAATDPAIRFRSGATQIAFTPDRRRMVSAHLDGAWRVRNGTTGAVLREVNVSQRVWCVAFSPSGWLLAVGSDNSVTVYDTASWQEVAHCEGHNGTVKTVFFSADSGTLISCSPEDGTVLVWSLKSTTGDREAPDPAKLWADLAGNGSVIRQAVWAAADHQEIAIKLFRGKWPVPKDPLDLKRVAKLISALDSADFAERETATAELEKLGHRVEAALRKEAAENPSEETKRRLEKILARLSESEAAELPPEEARELRAVWALELAGTAEAQKLLTEWAAAKVGIQLGEESAAALKRLSRKKR